MHSRSLTLRMMSIGVLVAMMVSAVGLAPVRAQEPDATVTPDKLNMRYGPGTEYAVVAELVRDTTLTLLGQNGNWVFGRTPSNDEGWVASGYIDIRADLNIASLPFRAAPPDLAPPTDGSGTADEPAAPPPADFPPGTGIPAETSATVNMRSGPGTGYKVLATLSPGTSVLATGRNDALDWIFVTVNTQQGWLYYEYVRLTSGDISALPLEDSIVDAAAPAAGDADTGAGGAVPPPVAGGAGIAGFGYGGQVQSLGYADLMHYAGMTWVKRQVRFGMGTPGSVTAGAINEAHSNGFKILLSILGAANDVTRPGYFEDYARFVGEVAALGPDAIEVWNEMNLDREWATGHIDPASYTQLLALSYNAIKSANPNVAVISGAPSPTGAEGAFGLDSVWNDDHYLRGMVAAGATQYMDCIGAHYNEGIIGPNQTSGDPRSEYYTRYFWGMVNTYSSIFGGARPICFTELGYLSPEGVGPLPAAFAWGGNTTVAEQATWLAQAIQLSRSSGKVRLVIVWNIDYPNYGSDPMGGYAIVRPDGSCPACDALAGN